jgi:hypothetical protein
LRRRGSKDSFVCSRSAAVSGDLTCHQDRTDDPQNFQGIPKNSQYPSHYLPSVYSAPPQRLLSTSPAPTRHLPSVYSAPPQRLLSTSPAPTQHIPASTQHLPSVYSAPPQRLLSTSPASTQHLPSVYSASPKNTRV